MSDKEFNLNHPEAFAVLRYICENCGEKQIVWNSRDGVSAFGISSVCCEGKISHCENGRMHFKSHEVPTFAEVSLVIVSMTYKTAKRLAQEKFNRTGEKMMSEFPHLKEMGKEKMIADSVKSIFHEGMQPHYITVEEYEELMKSESFFALQYFNGDYWVTLEQEWGTEEGAWASLGGDNFNYRTVVFPQEVILTDKSIREAGE